MKLPPIRQCLEDVLALIARLGEIGYRSEVIPRAKGLDAVLTAAAAARKADAS